MGFKNIRYVHLMTDHFYSKKFIEIIHSNFDFKKHLFIIIRQRNKEQFISTDQFQNIVIYNVPSNIIKRLFFIEIYLKRKIRKILRNTELIFIHFLKFEFCLIFFRSHLKAKLFWIIWGADLYNTIPFKLYDPYTSNLLKEMNNIIRKSFEFIYFFLYGKIQKKVIKKLDLIISAYRGDLILLYKYFDFKGMDYLEFNYPNPVDFEKIDDNLSNSNDEITNSKKNKKKLILIGNSGHPTNNHLDLMIRLSKINEKDFRIVCPLSYGPPKYIREIIKKGKNLFGKDFIPLTRFLPPKKYYKILKKIDIAIMYHNRQQALGNINILLYLKKPICMKKTSIFFDLVRKKASIFPSKKIEQIILNDEMLDEEIFVYNKKLAKEYLSVETSIYYLKKLFKFVEDNF